MGLSWITTNENLQNGIAVINSISNDNFKDLLQAVLKSKQENTFSPEELEKLQKSLELSTDNLNILVQSTLYMFRQSSKLILKPTILQKQLVQHLKLNSDKAEEFVRAWTNVTKEHFDDLENRLKLTDVNWELNVQTSSNACIKQAIPNVRIKLSLTDLVGANNSNVLFELNEDELLQMYNTLENIQNKLDYIHNSANK